MKLRIALLTFAFALMTGCSTTAPVYPASVNNLQALKAAKGTTVNVGPFTADGAAANNASIGLRAVQMTSPKGSYSNYLHDALVQDLTDAGLYDAKSGTQVTAVLLKNDISAAGVSTASGMIEARFTVSRDGKQLFDKTKHGALEWESHFVGNIAIDRAKNNYPNLVTAMLHDLYSDPDFINSLKQ